MKIQFVMGMMAAAVLLPASVVGAEAPKTLEIGSAAPAFSLPGIDGKTHALADYKDAKALCVIFTCNHCPDAVAAATRMEPLYQDYKGKGVAMVAVNSNNPDALTPDELGYSPYTDSFEEMTPFAKENGWTFDYVYDGEKQEFATVCGAQATPHVFLFDGERKLVFTGRMDDMKRTAGPTEKSYLREALDAVLAGKEVAEKTPRPFGCSTKWLYKKDIAVKDEAAWKAKPVTLEDLSLDLAKKLRANNTKNFRLINFWSTTCGPCVAEFPDLVETYRRFQNRSVEFVSISIDPIAKKPAALKFLQSRHAAIIDKTMPALESEGRTTNNYIWSTDNTDPLADAVDKEWSGALPHTVLLAPDGKIVWRATDKVDVVELRRQLLKALE